MSEQHYTVEDFQKCEILRGKGYKVESYSFKYNKLIPGAFGIIATLPATYRRLIAYKEDVENITDEFALRHLMENVFDRVVAGTEY